MRGDVAAAGRLWSTVLWLIPVLSIGDLMWAISAKAGLGITLGLGLYKLEMIHIIIQAALMVALSLFFVVFSSSPGESYEVNEVHERAPGEEKER